ncbi:hypothetical protein [Nocardia xishanensis]
MRKCGADYREGGGDAGMLSSFADPARCLAHGMKRGRSVKSSWMAALALVAVAVPGCSADKSVDTAATSSAAPAHPAGATTTASKDADPAGGIRIPLGETRKVPIPADAIMEITVLAEWGAAVNTVRCTVTDNNGRNEDLRSSEPKKQEHIAGKKWITLWAFSSPPATEVTVGCQDVGNVVADPHLRYIRVVPRGLKPS